MKNLSMRITISSGNIRFFSRYPPIVCVRRRLPAAIRHAADKRLRRCAELRRRQDALSHPDDRDVVPEGEASRRDRVVDGRYWGIDPFGGPAAIRRASRSTPQGTPMGVQRPSRSTPVGGAATSTIATLSPKGKHPGGT